MFEPIVRSSAVRKRMMRIIVVMLAAGLVALVLWLVRMIDMPLASYKGSLPALSSDERGLGAAIRKACDFSFSKQSVRAMLETRAA